jgi:hypothetical protein
LLKAVHRAGGRQVEDPRRVPAHSPELVDFPEAGTLLRDLHRRPLADAGFTPISGLLGGVLKEIGRRCALRWHLEAERGGPIDDEAFIEVAERTGITIQILADSSATEEHLRECLRAVYPILERLHEATAT